MKPLGKEEMKFGYSRDVEETKYSYIVVRLLHMHHDEEAIELRAFGGIVIRRVR